MRLRLVKALGALVLVQLSLAAYNVLAKAATDGGLDPGLLVLARDGTTAVVCAVACRLSMGSWAAMAPRREHRLPALALGLLGIYFGQYLAVLGLAEGTPVLAALWWNVAPPATFVLGLWLGTERPRLDLTTLLKVAGVVVAVGGAALSTAGARGGVGAPPPNPVVASALLLLSVLFGGAGFYHRAPPPPPGRRRPPPTRPALPQSRRRC